MGLSVSIPSIPAHPANQGFASAGRPWVPASKATPVKIQDGETVDLIIDLTPVKGSGEPNKIKVAEVTRAQLEEIAKTKMQDLNAADIDGAINIIAGTARSMGIDVVD